MEEELRSKTWMTTDTPPSSAAGCLQRRHTLLYGFSISYQHGTTLIGLPPIKPPLSGLTPIGLTPFGLPPYGLRGH